MKINPKQIIRILLPIITIFVLSGCFDLGGSKPAETKPIDERSLLYETSEFSITIPKTWEVIEKKDFTSDVPAETVVVFRNNVKNENFTANVVVVKNNLLEPIVTLEYAKMVKNRQKAGLIDYKESRQDESKITIGTTEEPTYFNLFEAKKSAQDKLVRYLQTYAVKGNSAYIITGAVLPTENDATVKTIEDTVKTFKLK